MIFQTIKNDADGAIYKIGILGKSIGEIFDHLKKRQEDIDLKLKEGLSEKEAKSQVGSRWSYLSKSFSEQEKRSIEEFEKLFNSTSIAAEECAKQTNVTNKAVIEYANSVGNGNFSTETFMSSLQGVTVKARAATVAVKALSIAGNMLATLLVTELVKGLYNVFTASDRIAEQTKEVGSEIKDITDDIDNYKDEIESLYEVINNSSSSSEVLNARKQLLKIQDEMIKKYGTEKGKIDYVTQSVYGYIESIKKLKKEEWNRVKNEYDSVGWIERLTDVIPSRHWNKSNMAIDEYERQTASFGIPLVEFQLQDAENIEEVENALKRLGFTVSETNKGKFFDITGNANDVAKALSSAQSIFENFGFSDNVIEDIKSVSGETQKIVSSYKDFYDQYVYYEDILSNDTYENYYNKLIESYENYQNALVNGDSDAVNTAIKEYSDVLTNAMDIAVANGNTRVANYLQDMYPVMDSIISQWKFKTNVLPTINTSSLQGQDTSHVLEMLQTDGIQDGENAFNEILDKAVEYGIVTDDSADSIQQLLNLLVQWKILQGDIVSLTGQTKTQSFSSLFNNLPMDKIEEYMELLDNGDLTEETVKSYSEISMIINETGISAENAMKYLESFRDSFTSSMDLTTGINDAYDALQTVEKELKNSGKISLETLNSLSSVFPELASSFTDYTQGLLSANDLLNLLKEAYYNDANAFRASMVLKLSGNETFFNNIRDNNEALFTKLALAYGTDIQNWKNLAEAKAAIDEALMNALADKWGEYYGSFDQNVVKGENGLYSLVSDDPTIESEGTWQEMQEIINQRNQIILALQKAAETEIKLPDFGGIGDDNDSGNGSSDSDPNKYDWIERRNEILSRTHEQMEEISNDETQSYNERISAIQELINIDKERVEFAKQAAEKYREVWEEAMKGLTADQVNKIMNGDVDITVYSDDEQKRVKDAIESYDEMIEYEDKLSDLVKETNEHLRESVKLREEIIQAQQDELSSQLDVIQSRIDLADATGGIVTEGMYKEQIALSKELVESYEDQIDNLYEQRDLVDDGSAEYYSLTAQIRDCESAILECKAQQAEWNEAIKRLPIERIQKYINMLQNIKQDLQNFIDEQNTIGISTTVDQYQQLMDISQKEIDKLLEQQEKLSDLLNDYKYGSEKFNDVQNEIQDIDDEISSLIQKQYEWNNAIMQIPITQIEDINDKLSLYSDTLGEVLDDYDSTLNAVNGVIDAQIDKIEELKEATEEEYEAKIKPLQDELDLLQEQNEERSIQLALEQAQYDLERAKNQKTNQVVRNGELVWEANQDDIRQANSDYQDALYNKAVYDLEKQIEILEEERDAILANYDEEIERLTDIQDKWSKIVEEIQLAADILKANQTLGDNWQDKVLSGNDTDIYEMFKKLYETTSTEKNKVDEQIASNERIAEMMKQFVEMYQSGAITYEQAIAGIKELSTSMKDGYTAMEQLSGLMNLDGIKDVTNIASSTEGKITESVVLLEEYLGIAKKNSDALSQYTSTWEEMKDNISKQLEQLEKMAKELEEYLKNRKQSSSSSGGGGGSSANVESHGTIYADGTVHINNPNISGHYTGSKNPSGGKGESGYVNSGPGAKYDEKDKYAEGINRGVIKGTEDSTSKLLRYLSTNNIKSGEVPIIAHEGEVVLNSDQQQQLLDNFKHVTSSYNMIEGIMKSGIPRVDQGKSENIEVNFDGDIILQGVQDPDGLARAIKMNISSKMRQVMSQRN